MISRRAEGPDRKRFRFALGNENAQSYLLVSTPRPSGPGTGKHRRQLVKLESVPSDDWRNNRKGLWLNPVRVEDTLALPDEAEVAERNPGHHRLASKCR